MIETDKKPAVSVIIPTYNRRQLIERSVKSVLSQTYQDFEIIIVDDGSTDNTEEAVANIKGKRIKYIRHDKNKGEAAARNTGIKAAGGEYIASHDSDDEWLPEKLEKQIKAFENCPPEVGVVYTGFWKVEKGQRTYVPFKWINKKEGDIHCELLRGNFIGSPATLIKKECFEKAGMFNEKIFHLVDWELWLRISKYYHFKYIDEPLAVAHYHSDNVSLNYRAFISAVEFVLGKYSDEFENNKRLLIKHYTEIGNLLITNGQIRNGRSYLIKALKIAPLNVKSLVAVPLTFLGRNIYNRTVSAYQKTKSTLLYR